MPANTNHIAGTTVLSSLSLLGTLSALTSNSSALAIGGGTVPITRSFATSFSVVATTVVATKSTTTDATISGISTADALYITPKGSGLSAGVVVDAYCSAADTLTVRYSNVSTANAAQIATTFNLVAFRF